MRFFKLMSMILPLFVGDGLAALLGAHSEPVGIAFQLCDAGVPGIGMSETVQAADRQITVGSFRFRIVRVAFDTTATGFVPEDLGPKDLLMFVECQLLSGNRDEFKGLSIVLDKGPGGRSRPVALFSEGMMKALTALTVKSASFDYRPADSNIVWAFIVQEAEGDFTLIFPTGTVVDLAPWIEGRNEEIGETRHPIQDTGRSFLDTQPSRR